MPMNPFEPWLPMYPETAHPERPWWRRVSVDVGGPHRQVVEKWTRVWDNRGPLYAHDLAGIDEAYPVDVPPPMPGQVWVLPDGDQQTVSRVAGTPWTIVFFHATYVRDDEWPLPGAVLVAGPTPWGWNVPWAPAGRKP